MIIIEHGFDQAAQERTRNALENDGSPVTDPRGGYDFYFDLGSTGTVRCRQKVVGNPNTYGVITSYIEAW